MCAWFGTFSEAIVEKKQNKLGGRFGYFLIFFCLGRGKGESEARRQEGIGLSLIVLSGVEKLTRSSLKGFF